MTVTSAPTKPLRWRVWRGTTWQNILDNSIRVKSATMSAQRQTIWNCTMLPNTKALDMRVISVVIKQPRLADWTGTKNWSTGTNEEVTRSQICTTPTMRKYLSPQQVLVSFWSSSDPQIWWVSSASSTVQYYLLVSGIITVIHKSSPLTQQILAWDENLEKNHLPF